MRARSITRAARSSIPQSHAVATVPGVPATRCSSRHPDPLHNGQFSIGISPQAYGHSSVTASFLPKAPMFLNLTVVKLQETQSQLSQSKKLLDPIPMYRLQNQVVTGGI